MEVIRVQEIMAAHSEHARLAHDPAYKDGSAYVIDRICPIAEAAIPLTDSGFTHSDAVYDVISVSRGSFFRLGLHQERFSKALALTRMRNPLSSEEEAENLNRLVALTGLKDAYVFWTVTRGSTMGGRGDFLNPERFQNRLYAYVTPYVFICDDEQRARGIDLVVSRDRIRIPSRAVDPRAKNFHWLDLMMSLFEARERGAEWSVLPDESGYLTEAPGTNIFAVKDGVVLTPDSGCLEGITRQTVIDLCKDLDVPCKLTKVHVDELRGADEAFLSSTAGGVMPVNRVDDNLLGGKDGPGELTTRLHNAYWERRWEGWDATPVRY